MYLTIILFFVGCANFGTVKKVETLTDSKLISNLFIPNFEDAHQIILKLQKMNFDSANINETTYLISRLVTIQAHEYEVIQVNNYPHWREASRAKDNITKNQMFNFAKRGKVSLVADYALQLFEKNFGNSRKILLDLAQIRPGAGYLDVFLIQAAHSHLNLHLSNYFFPNSLPQSEKLAIEKLLIDTSVLTWIQSLGTSLRQFSGMTHTISGLYDWISYPKYQEATGFSDISTDAEAYYDLGGGFATPDVDRIFNKKFTSLDILSPQKALDWNIVIQTLTAWHLPKFGINQTTVQTKDEREAYLQQVAQVPWIYFDVFKDHIPTSSQSYVITSFGFLSSTIGSLSTAADTVEGGNNYYSLTYWATKRIVELIAAGKSVDLFTYQRATAKNYRYRTVFLSFKNRQLIKAKFYPDGEKDLNSDAERILKRTEK